MLDNKAEYVSSDNYCDNYPKIIDKIIITSLK